VTDNELWATQAVWWQQGFTGGVDAEYTEQILPLLSSYLSGAELILDAGCGEGQCARHLAAGGSRVVGIDVTLEHLRVACARSAGDTAYLRGSVEALPIRDGSVDAAMMVLVLEHILEWRSALAQVARVVRPGGKVALLLNHPLLQTPDSGWIDDRILGEQYWRVGPYLVEDESLEEIERGVTLRFCHRPLSLYINAAVDGGLDLVRMDEPAPPPGFLARAPEYPAAATIPRLMALLFRRRDHAEGE
jgi:SAM-dependent methyltransferase